MIAKHRVRKARSQCGKYVISDVDAHLESRLDLPVVRIADGQEMTVVRWSNEGTPSRCGCHVEFRGGGEARFSWPRHRGVVVKRWVFFFGVDYQQLHDALVAEGVVVEEFTKPDINVYIHLRMRGKPSVIDEVLRRFVNPEEVHSRRPRGAWDIY